MNSTKILRAIKKIERFTDIVLARLRKTKLGMIVLYAGLVFVVVFLFVSFILHLLGKLMMVLSSIIAFDWFDAYHEWREIVKLFKK